MIHKAFVIMETIAKHKSTTIDVISESTGIPRSTVHRILKVLQEEGAVLKSTGKGYALTPKLLSIGLRGIAERDMLDVSIPVMRALSETTRETVSINVISGYERVCIYRIEGTQPITRSIRIGSQAPLFRGSAGKVIASALTNWERDRILKVYLEEGWLEEKQVPSILSELDKIREQGYSISQGERVEGSASIAVPIRDIMDHAVGALSLATIAERLTAENRKRYVELLIKASEQIHESLCFVN
ncbi:IclR family transcriptional regulator [Clostridia bacterium OttesenSCG-928-O13]|nr:IclR family transcriptional regulator [Clostridia bacterium OttesenSCG-928-O13]